MNKTKRISYLRGGTAKARADLRKLARQQHASEREATMPETDKDPGEMNGREITERLAGHIRRSDGGPQSAANIALWAGVAIARLLEYQRKLEAAGLLDSGEAVP